MRVSSFMPTVTRLAFAAAMAVIPAILYSETQNIPIERYDRFKLWNNCKPLRPGAFVYNYNGNADVKGLSVRNARLTNKAETVVRRRFRTARIYDEPGLHPVILAEIRSLWHTESVHVLLYGVELKFQKYVTDDVSGENWIATVWERSDFGMHDDPEAYVLKKLSEFTDEFIEEYLRVNADAC